MSDTLRAWACKLPLNAASFVGSLHITLQPTLTWWGVAIFYALGLDFFFVLSSITTVFAYAQSALIYMAAFIICLIWSLYSLAHCLIYCFIYMLYEWIYSYRRYTPTRAVPQDSYLRNLDAYVDPNRHGHRRSKPAKSLQEVHEAGEIAGVDMASEGNGAAARSSSSPCNDVMCSCPDLPCTDVPAVHVIDDLSATIRSSTNLLCPLAFPRSTKTSCSHSRRKGIRLTLRNISLGSSSKLMQSSPLVACRSFPVTDSIAHVLFPWSSILVYDKGIAFS